MTPREVRYALAASIEGFVPDNWTTYAAPPEGATAPAVVIGPRSPYRQGGRLCGDEVRLGVVLLVQRAGSVAGLDLLDDVAALVIEGIHATVGITATVDDITDVGPTQEVGGPTYLTASLNVTVLT